MAEQQGVSFSPDDASGLVDNIRAIVTAVKVDFFTAASGVKYVNVDVTYKGTEHELTEHYLLGGADKWAPNAGKNGAIPVVDGGRVWNKSDVFKLVKSFIDAGFPKLRIGNDLSVLVGSDVQLSRVSQEGNTYIDKKTQQERTRTVMLVTKLFAAPGEKAAAPAAKASKVTATTAAVVESNDDSNDTYVTELLLEILGENNNAIERTKLPQPAFIKMTRAKKTAIREAAGKRIQDEAFLGSLVEAGLIAYDGKVVTLAA
jgi:hypothetical protein